MERVALILAAVLALAPAPYALAQAAAPAPEKSRQELENIQNRVESRKKELDLYRKKERDLNRYIDFLKRQEESAGAARVKLSREIDQAEKSLNETERRSSALGSSLRRWGTLAAQDMRSYWLAQLGADQYYGSSKLPEQIYLQSAIYQKAALIGQLRGESERVQRQMSVWKRTSRELVNRSGKLKKDDAIRKLRYEKNLAERNSARDRNQRLEREIGELKASAKNLLAFLENFEKKQQAAHGASSARGAISIQRHSLPWPVSGALLSGYGRQMVPALKTWIFREGIKISAQAGEPVLAVLDGEVIYAGPFRSYGNVVIVDHRRGFFSVYGFLRDISVRKGDQLEARQEIGAAGTDGEAASYSGAGNALYFEIRSGTNAVNPVDWLTTRRN
ncbi:MAG: peptidoglycan DD-metalloendopeptidase family protein [Elusimicrobiales bacterium]|nr:peptidoglycan DD-metalloendopeptidase family protein [Elusimicrobiales bacterium]